MSRATVKKPARYYVFSTALGKFTATTKPNAEQASSRDYKVFPTRTEAQTWADAKNGKGLAT
jgi:hypothetical protein